MALTRGNPVGPLALLSLLHPAKGSYIAVVDVDGGRNKMIGQVVHLTGQRSAHLAFVLPEGNTDAYGRVALLEALAREAGEMGALSVVAELEDSNPMVENLRRAGFSIFCWQRIWKLPGGSTNESPLWQEAKPEDEFAIRSLFHAVAPPMVQSAETPPPQRAGLAFKQNGNLLAYVEGRFRAARCLSATLVPPRYSRSPGAFRRIGRHDERLEPAGAPDRALLSILAGRQPGEHGGHGLTAAGSHGAPPGASATCGRICAQCGGRTPHHRAQRFRPK